MRSTRTERRNERSTRICRSVRSSLPSAASADRVPMKPRSRPSRAFSLGSAVERKGSTKLPFGGLVAERGGGDERGVVRGPARGGQQRVDGGPGARKLALGDDEEQRGVGPALQVGDERSLVLADDVGRDIGLDGVEAGVARRARAAGDSGVEEDGDDPAIAEHAATGPPLRVDLEPDGHEQPDDLLAHPLGLGGEGLPQHLEGVLVGLVVDDEVPDSCSPLKGSPRRRKRSISCSAARDMTGASFAEAGGRDTGPSGASPRGQPRAERARTKATAGPPPPAARLNARRDPTEPRCLQGDCRTAAGP